MLSGDKTNVGWGQYECYVSWGQRMLAGDKKNVILAGDNECWLGTNECWLGMDKFWRGTKCFVFFHITVEFSCLNPPSRCHTLHTVHELKVLSCSSFPIWAKYFVLVALDSLGPQLVVYQSLLS
jgi:hypothetical protein